MNFITLTYALMIGSSGLFFVRFGSFKNKIFLFSFLFALSLVPWFNGLSVTQWIDSICGEPSVFLLFLSLSVCFVYFYVPKEEVLPLRSKAFIVVFGFVLYLGNLNLLWGFDLYSSNYLTQLIAILGILFFSFMLDAYLGILYLCSLLVYAVLREGNIFSYLIDVVVWLYALLWFFFDGIINYKKQRRN